MGSLNSSRAIIYFYLFAVRFLLTHSVKVEIQPPKKQKNEAMKSIEDRLEKLEQALQSKDSLLQSETMVSKLWRNRIAAKILQLSTNEDLESLTKLGPEELLSKYEEVMVNLALSHTKGIFPWSKTQNFSAMYLLRQLKTFSQCYLIIVS